MNIASDLPVLTTIAALLPLSIGAALVGTALHGRDERRAARRGCLALEAGAPALSACTLPAGHAGDEHADETRYPVRMWVAA